MHSHNSVNRRPLDKTRLAQHRSSGTFMLPRIRSLALDGDDEDDEEEYKQTDKLVFEEALSNICRKFDCSYSIIVRKKFQRDTYLNMLKSEPKTKYKRINVMAPLQLQASQTFGGSRKPGDVAGDGGSNDSALYGDSTSVIVKALYDSMDRLAEIVIKDVHKVPRIMMQVIALLAPYYDQLTKITIARCGLNVYTLHELNKMLPLTAVTDICLDASTLQEGNYAILLENSSHLRHLSLSNCHINDEVCKQIAGKLHFLSPAEKTLMLLNLSSNHITDIGAKYLSEALRTNRHLRYLNIADNELTDIGASHLFNALTEFPLTIEEIRGMRRRFMDFIRHRMNVYLKFLDEYHTKSPADDESCSRKSGRKSGKCAERQKAGNKTPTTTNMMATDQLEMRADTLAGETVGPFVDPYEKTCLRLKDGWTYCLGNLVLSYLNLAYNNITYVSIKKIVNVLTHQSRVAKFSDSGLMKIVIEGNFLPDSCQEVSTIHNLLCRNMTRFSGKGLAEAAGRRKSITRARISMIPEIRRAADK